MSCNFSLGSPDDIEDISDELLIFFKETLERLRPKVSSEFGVVFDFPIGKNFTVLSGIKYVEWGNRIKKGNPYGVVWYKYLKIKERNTFVEIPIRLRYYRNLKRGGFFIFYGNSPVIHISSKGIATYYYHDGTKETIKEKDEFSKFRKINLVGEFGIGYENSISNNITFSINPVFKIHNFTFINDKDLPVNARLYFYGVTFGLMFKSKNTVDNKL